MKTIIKPDQLIPMILGSRRIDFQGIEFSKYVQVLEYKGNVYLYSLFTGEVVRLSNEEYNAVCDSIASTSNDFMSAEECSKLISRYFLVKQGEDEQQNYLKTKKLYQVLKNEKPGIFSYTILPTTACNARCVYCFEEGMKFTTMREETALEVVEYIKKTKQKGKIKLQWFGGEPSLAPDKIELISKKLSEEKIEFEAVMITNASLFDEQLVSRAASIWHLTKVQITLDGTEKEYLKRKKYLTDCENVWGKVINAIHLFQNAGVQVSIRLNLDRDNVEELKKCIDFLNTDFPDKTGLIVYVGFLYQEQCRKDSLPVWKNGILLEKYAKKLGFRPAGRHEIGVLPQYACMADHWKKAVVISPNGDLCSCECCNPSTYFGNIRDGVTNQEKYKYWTKPNEVREKCNNCSLLPWCTDFDKCPTVRENCEAATRMIIHHWLKQKIDEEEKQNA